MTLKKAKRIEELRTGKRIHSWRALSEVICEEFDDEDQSQAGNQLHGKYDLCWEAMKLLYEVDNMNDLPDEIRDKWDS